MRVVNWVWVVLAAVLSSTALAQGRFAGAGDANSNGVPNYSPLRPPAIPLAVRSPYTNVWSTTSGGSTLNSLRPTFWPGDPVGWEGIVTVDKVSYEYMGAAVQDLPFLPSFKSAVAQDVSFDSQYSNFTFLAGPVRVTASFFSPVVPRDTCRSSIPLSYLTTAVESTDGRPHRVGFYSDVDAAWIDEQSDDAITWDLYKSIVAVSGAGNAITSPDDLYSWIYQRKVQYVFGEQRDFPQWGNFSYSTSPMGATNFSFQSGHATSVRFGYVNRWFLADNVAPAFRGFGSRAPVFAFAHNFDSVTNASVRYTIGSIQDPVVKYLHRGGLAALTPWWKKCYGNLHEMIHFHWDDFDDARALGNAFEAQLKADVNAFYEGVEAPVCRSSTSSDNPWKADGTDQYGQEYVHGSDTAYGFPGTDSGSGVAVPLVSEAESYYAIVALSARQVMGAYVYAEPPEDPCGLAGSSGGGARAAGDPLVFQKEISSNGNTNTVDVLYPASPFFLYADPALLRRALQPLCEFQEAGLYPNGYCAHDLGARFPNATGHVEGDDEHMPVEESGDWVLMAYAYYRFGGDAEYLRAHYPLLRRFARYLVDFSLIPAAQLSTDDFAGALANQSNLALKGILGLQAMSAIARVVGEEGDAGEFSRTAVDYYGRWEEMAMDPAKNHTMLAYQWRSSWGLLYNLYMDKLLNLGIASGTLYDAQSAFYATVSQTYGVPLDSRHAYTKSDWQAWAAATSSATTRRLIVGALARWLNETATTGPFGDLFQAAGDGGYPPGQPAFRARPVVGGHFALLALARSGQRANATGADTAGSLFPRNGTQALPPPDGAAGVPGLPIPQPVSSGPKKKKTPSANKRVVERLGVGGAGMGA
ncbi:hypothetical protein DL762_007491 [Monosporascus cannonballus]|uniref:Glutaminase n=1 Tax=Monosporascus cannonballus TaxID=155416 RepID=A0ABY0H3I4_9PEZI|nr:hypothetical protein DL762_007491 [Monosporascus cannonballus]